MSTFKQAQLAYDNLLPEDLEEWDELEEEELQEEWDDWDTED